MPCGHLPNLKVKARAMHSARTVLSDVAKISGVSVFEALSGTPPDQLLKESYPAEGDEWKIFAAWRN